MKIRWLLFLVGAAAVVVTAAVQAAPLQRELIIPEAKWLLHFDVDKFRQTKVGSYVVGIVQKKLDEKTAELAAVLDFELPLDKVHSVSAFGGDFKASPDANGVFLLLTEPKTGKQLKQVLAGLLQVQAEDEKGLQKLADASQPTYLIDEEVHLSSPEDGVWLASKSAESLKEAMALQLAQSASVQKNKRDVSLQLRYPVSKAIERIGKWQINSGVKQQKRGKAEEKSSHTHGSDSSVTAEGQDRSESGSATEEPATDPESE